MTAAGHPAPRPSPVCILRALLHSRAPGVAVPEVANLLELNTMLAETVLDWKRQWLEEGKAEVFGEHRSEATASRLTPARDPPTRAAQASIPSTNRPRS